jgi:hypothetical protein
MDRVAEKTVNFLGMTIPRKVCGGLRCIRSDGGAERRIRERPVQCRGKFVGVLRVAEHQAIHAILEVVAHSRGRTEDDQQTAGPWLPAPAN